MNSVWRTMPWRWAVVCLLWVTAAVVVAAPAPATRLAVIGIHVDEPTAHNALALVEAELSQDSQVQLVERLEISRVLQEHALAMSLGPVNEQGLKVGQLLGADLLLLMEPLAPDRASDGAQVQATDLLWRVHLVETRDGLRLWEGGAISRADGGDMVELQELVRQARQRLAAYRRSGGQMPAITLSGWTSRELSSGRDTTGQALDAGVRQLLLRQEDLVVTERRYLDPLQQERDLVAELPERLRASTAVVEGSYGIDRMQSPHRVQVLLRVRRGGTILLERSLSSEIDQTDDLCRQLAQAIVTTMNVPQTGVIDQDAEAAVLTQRARRLIAMRHPQQAIELLQASVALAPRRTDAKLLLVHVIPSVTERQWDLRGDGRQFYFRHIVPLHFQHLRTTLELIEDTDLMASVPREPFIDDLSQFLIRLPIEIRVPARVAFKMGKDPQGLEVVRELALLARAIFERWAQVVPPRYSQFQVKQTAIDSGVWWCKDAGEYVAMVRGIIANSVFQTEQHVWLFDPRFHRVNFTCPLWPRDDDVDGAMISLLDWMKTQDRLVVKAAGHLWSSRYWGNGRKQDEPAMRELNLLVDFTIEQWLPREPEMAAWFFTAYWGPMVNVMWANLRDDSVLLPLDQRLFEAALAAGNIQLAKAALKPMVQRLRQLKRLAEAESAVGRWLAAVDTQNMKPRQLAEFAEWKQLHQELQLTLAPAQDQRLKSEVVLKLEDLLVGEAKDFSAKRSRLAGWIPGPKAASVVVIEDGESYPDRQDRLALIELDAATLKPRASRVAPAFFRSAKFGEFGGSVRRRYQVTGVNWALHGEDIYIGLPQAGILVFPAEGGVRHLTESTGLATDMVCGSLAVLDDRLYAIVGESFLHASLMEYDLRTGQCRLLASPRDDSGQGDLHGHHMTSVVADPPRHQLLITSSHSPILFSPVGLFAYQPATRGASNVGGFFMQNSELRLVDGRIQVIDFQGGGWLDPETATTAWIVAGPNQYRDQARFHLPSAWVQSWAPLGPDVVVLNQDTQQRRSLLHLREGQPEPARLDLALQVDANKACDLVSSGEQMLLVMNDRVLRLAVAQPVDPPPP